MAVVYLGARHKGVQKLPKGPFIATQLNSTDLLRADWVYAVQLGQLHCRSSATVELRW